MAPSQFIVMSMESALPIPFGISLVPVVVLIEEVLHQQYFCCHWKQNSEENNANWGEKIIAAE